jgi:hypothetical protein
MTTLPELGEYDLAEQPAWERQRGEPTKSHSAFRIYRDRPAHERNLEAVSEQVGTSYSTVRRWADRWGWRERAEAWDDACHQVEDRERLEALRAMHSTHRRAGQAAIVKALEALQLVDAGSMPVGTIARLLELGAKLERSTLVVSVEELQGLDGGEEGETEDPWERIARELDPHSAPDL